MDGISSPPPSSPSTARSFPLTLPAALLTLDIVVPNALSVLPWLFVVGSAEEEVELLEGFSLALEEDEEWEP
jgi:hypothetical protein